MKYIITLIFILALIIRFAYFPENVYFAYDQARDSYFAGEILNGDIRLIGPPSAASDKFFPGPLSLYIYSSVYGLFGPDPALLSAFFRIYNALGVFLVFLIGSKLFDKKVGILGTILYAFSYEASQYALFMSHQPLAVLPVLLLYLGLAIFLFEKRSYGLILALLGLGLSIQFHYVYILLIPIVILMVFVFRKDLPKLKPNDILASQAVLLLSISTYIIAEFKFGFRMLKGIFSNTQNSSLYFNEATFAIKRFIHDSFLSNYNYSLYLIIILGLLFGYYLWKLELRKKALFLILWFTGGILPYLFSGTSSYYYSAAASVSLFLFFSFLVIKIYSRLPVIGIILFLSVMINNIFLIKTQNPNGPNKDIVIQPGMLITKEKEVIDYIYQGSDGKFFAVRALTIPLNINTTWSYLFEWYGKQKYGYLPTWSEKPAEGFPGNLGYQTDRSGLPETQFVIIEPTVGIRDIDKERFFVEEGYFTKMTEERSFGTIIVQKRGKI